MTTTARARCACGTVEIAFSGSPIASVVCYCDDCQEGGRRIEALPAGRPVRDADGGTAYVVYRRDRVQCVAGEAQLEPHKLRPESATSRVVASCCGSAMLLRFDGGKFWWTDVYRARLVSEAPATEMRVCTKFRERGDLTGAAEVPSYPGYPLRFVARLVAARMGMLLGR
jgi:hypothetical protein